MSVAASPTTTPTPPTAALLPVAVIGAGSWGTALAIQFARAGHPTRLWGRDAAQRERMARERQNPRYLPGAAFPDTLSVAPTLDAALDGARDLLVAVPSHALRATLTELRPRLRPDLRLAWATKGFELDTGLLPHQVARQVLGSDVPIAVLSGPTFAREVGAGLPTAMTVASPDPGFASALATSLSSSNFRAYTSTDIIGVEVGGAVKNVLALGAGLSDGLGFGANTRIALITRGLVEMTRLGVALGAQPRDLHGPRRARRPGADLHRRPVAQPPLRAGARRRPRPRGGARARSARWSRATWRLARSAQSRSAPASRCRSRKACIARCTKACPRARS